MILALGDYRNCYLVKKSLKHMCLRMQNLNPCLLVLRNTRKSESSRGDLFKQESLIHNLRKA